MSTDRISDDDLLHLGVLFQATANASDGELVPVEEGEPTPESTGRILRAVLEDVEPTFTRMLEARGIAPEEEGTASAERVRRIVEEVAAA